MVAVIDLEGIFKSGNPRTLGMEKNFGGPLQGAT